eukprot:TRINITY_DN23730_c0_g1_i1.p1 TRINITY_DN23730_c0_g1~~TRINITY_DN23730_c0_g1_i1.p1  ORF type:complete len:268 (-),score=3.20 TRINITY_DN23730_c0_g1_i1:274-1077(-)
MTTQVYGRVAMLSVILLQFLVKPCHGWGFTLFDSSSYTGTYWSPGSRLSGVSTCVKIPTAMNDKASSVIFYWGDMPSAYNVLFYRDFDCKNTRWSFSPANGRAVPGNWNNLWSSFRIDYNRPEIFTLYEERCYNGVARFQVNPSISRCTSEGPLYDYYYRAPFSTACVNLAGSDWTFDDVASSVKFNTDVIAAQRVVQVAFYKDLNCAGTEKVFFTADGGIGGYKFVDEKNKLLGWYVSCSTSGQCQWVVGFPGFGISSYQILANVR